jgi:putative glutamine amidotransferase
VRRPLLGIVSCFSAGAADPGHSVADRYVRPVAEQSGASVVLIPAVADRADADALAHHLDGVLLAGSPSNVEPARFGSRDAGTGPFDPARDATSLALIKAMVSAAKPVFGICRGMQEINVAFGGTLRHIDHCPLHHAGTDVVGAEMFDHRHPVRLVGGSLGAGDVELEVNSVHYQAIDRLGEGLIVEAVSAAAAPVIAVQWHPEWNTVGWAGSTLFFTALRRMLEAVP